jgi:hypothetical protein
VWSLQTEQKTVFTNLKQEYKIYLYNILIFLGSGKKLIAFSNMRDA